MVKEAILSRVRLIMGNVHEFPCEPGYRLHHGERVAEIAASICAAENIACDPDILYFGALMHDIGKNGCPKGVSHAAHGAEIVREFFTGHFTADEMVGVCEIITHHCARPKSKWYEGREQPSHKPIVLAVQDADILDHFGPSEIWISMHWAAAKNSPPEETARYWFASNDWRAESRRSLNFASSLATLEKHIAGMNAFYQTWIR